MESEDQSEWRLLSAAAALLLSLSAVSFAPRRLLKSTRKSTRSRYQRLRYQELSLLAV